MIWLEQWRALAGRIEGLIRAGEFLSSAMRTHSADEFSVVRKSLKPELKSVTVELKVFSEGYGHELPPKGLEAIQRYIAGNWYEAMGKSGSSGASFELQVLAPLAAFRSECPEYLVRDTEIEGRNLTELAFEHLRRQIVVDGVRQKWQKAFGRHETACERLGAVHLLSHGIWAFKVFDLERLQTLYMETLLKIGLHLQRRFLVLSSSLSGRLSSNEKTLMSWREREEIRLLCTLREFWATSN
jgi:hypothetical protein